MESGRPALPRLGEDVLSEIDRLLGPADEFLRSEYPGAAATRQPVHTVYVPAHRFSAGAVSAWGKEALRLLHAHAPDGAALADATGVANSVTDQVYDRITGKLAREPIEDVRVDFEDGYGNRPDAVEDAAALAAAEAIADLLGRDEAPPYFGIRFKSFEAPSRRRGLRTLDLVLGALLDRGPLAEGFVVTLPKVTSVAQVEAMVTVCERLESAYGLPAGRLRFEIQVETPQAILLADGTSGVARMVHAAAGRCSSLHYGTFDYSASVGIAAAYQSLAHPAADHAKVVMQVAAAGTGVHLSDGSTNVLPVGTEAEIHSAWRLHAGLVRRSLERGYYQGWDMHPGHLPTRYLATYAFFREALPSAAARLRAYVSRTDSGVMDEPATAAALAGVVIRGLDCGALDEAEASSLTGLDRPTLDAFANRISQRTYPLEAP